MFMRKSAAAVRRDRLPGELSIREPPAAAVRPPHRARMARGECARAAPDSLLRPGAPGLSGSEFGLDPADWPRPRFLYLLEGNAADEDGSDERFHVAGGNDQITDRAR